jgi:hypothetical protein
MRWKPAFTGFAIIFADGMHQAEATEMETAPYTDFRTDPDAGRTPTCRARTDRIRPCVEHYRVPKSQA